MTLLIHLTCLYMTLLDFDRANVFFFSDPPKTDFPASSDNEYSTGD